MLYRETSTEILSSIIDDKAKSYYGTQIQYDYQWFCNPEFLRSTNIREYNYMTNELNYSILDGSLYEIGLPNTFVYVSSEISKHDMTFNIGQDPKIQIEFFDNNERKSVTSLGITLNFDGAYLPNDINIKYYNVNNSGTELKADDSFKVSSVDFFCNHGSYIENYNKVVITFNTTKYPYSFIKVNNIEYGCVYKWNSDDIESTSSLLNAKIIEETDKLSNTLAINTCEFTVYDEQDQFNIIDPNNVFNLIHKYQKVSVTETIRIYDDARLTSTYKIFMGEFYIKEWSSNVEHQLFFKCVDAIGILEDSIFNTPYIYNSQDVTVNTVLDNIKSCVNVIDQTNINYNIPDSIKNKKLKGFLPICSCRQALQQILFCIGAVADCSRSQDINIYIPDDNIKYNIKDDDNLEYEQIQKNDIVSDIEIYRCFLGDSGSDTVIYENQLVPLQSENYEVTCDKLIFPKQDVSPRVTSDALATASVVTGKPLNYFQISFELQEQRPIVYVEVTAHTYSINEVLISTATNSDAKIKKQIKCKNNYFLNNFDNNNYATDKLSELLKYYSKPNTMTTEFVLTGHSEMIQNEIVYNLEKTGNWCLIKNKYGNDSKGYISKMEIDLTGGLLVKAKLVCVEDIAYVEYNYICNNTGEVYSGENLGLI